MFIYIWPIKESGYGPKVDQETFLQRTQLDSMLHMIIKKILFRAVRGL